MKTETKKMLVRLHDTINQYTERANIVNGELNEAIEKVYADIIVNFKKNFKGKTLQQAFEFSESVIMTANENVTSLLREYALDVTTIPYELPQHKIKMITTMYTKVLLASKLQYVSINDLCYAMFSLCYAIPIRNAIKHRKLVLEERKNVKSN